MGMESIREVFDKLNNIFISGLLQVLQVKIDANKLMYLTLRQQLVNKRTTHHRTMHNPTDRLTMKHIFVVIGKHRHNRDIVTLHQIITLMVYLHFELIRLRIDKEPLRYNQIQFFNVSFERKK